MNSSLCRFITDLLAILFCSNEKIGIKMRKDVMEMVGTQLSHALVPYLFENMTAQVLKFFDQGGSVGFPIIQNMTEFALYICDVSRLSRMT